MRRDGACRPPDFERLATAGEASGIQFMPPEAGARAPIDISPQALTLILDGITAGDYPTWLRSFTVRANSLPCGRERVSG